MSEESSHDDLKQRIEELEQALAKAERMQRALRMGEEKYRSIAHRTPTATMLYQDNRWIFVNSAAEVITGYSSQDLLAMDFWEIVHPDYRDLIRDCGQKHKWGEQPATRYELKIIAKDGTEKWVDLVGASTMIGGRLAGVVSVVDITERKRAEEVLRESEERFRLLVENAPVGIFIQTRGQFAYVNKAAMRMFGGPSADRLLGQPILSRMHPDFHKIVLERTRLLNEEREEVSLMTQKYLKLDGTAFDVEVSAVPFVYGGEEGALAFFSDITEHVKAEDRARALLAAVQFERDRVSAVVNSMQDEVWFADMERKFTLANPSARREFRLENTGGIDVEDFARNLKVYRPDGSPRPVEEAPTLRALRGELVKNQKEIIFTAAHGELRHREVNAAPVRDTAGNIIGSVSVVRDITEAKRTEEALRRHGAVQEGINEILNATLASKTEEELGRVCLKIAERITQSQFGFIARIGGEELEIVAISDPDWQVCRIIGPTPGYRLGLKIRGIPGRIVLEGKPLLTNDPGHHPDSITIPDGPPPLEAFLGVPLIREGQTIGMIGVGNRPGGYRNADQETLEALVPAIVEAFLRKSAEEALGKAHEELELRVKERTAELEAAYRSLQSETQERLHLEEQLRQSQKMEAIGTLAGGIAHDFNNVLAGIIGFAEMVEEDLPEDSPLRRYMKRILKASFRGRDLVKQILAFSRKSEHVREPVSLAPVIEETLQLLRASLPATIEIVTDMRAASDKVRASAIELQQVVMNLATNAAHAMSEKGGTLRISLSDIDLEVDSPVIDPEVEPGQYVQLAIQDTGSGMTPDVIKRVFEPFFTTRRVGEGTGMGLAAVYGIVKSLNGAITVESDPGLGSIFRVFFPKISTCAESVTQRSDRAPGGTERILFVDDEELLVELAGDVLEKLGYRVTALTDSIEALNLFSSDPGSFDLVITDQTMPKMTGLRLATKLLKIRNDTPIILCTGHSDSVSPDIAREAGVRVFMMKPLTKESMAKMIRSVLDGTAV